MKLLAGIVCFTVFIVINVSADHELSVLEELRDFLKDQLHLSKRVIYDGSTSKEDYVSLIKAARRIAKDKVALYEILKANRSDGKWSGTLS